MATPMNEASRMGITAHITRWINNIQQYDNVPMDLTVYNLVLEAESNLRNVRNKFKRLTEAWWQRVTRDMEQARMTQEQFQAEIDSQIQTDEDVVDALTIVKRKKEEFKKKEDAEERQKQNDTLLLMLKTQQAAADAVRAQEKADQDAARAQEKIDEDAARAQERAIHKKVITQRQIEEDLARMRDRIAHQQAMQQFQRTTSIFPKVSNPAKRADDPAPIPPPDSK
jgi:hypothetical protein